VKSDTRAADYPFCAGCQDNLATCGYCRWFASETETCTHPVVAGIFEVGESATPPCVYHTPNERVAVSRRLQQGLIWAFVVAVIGLTAFGVARLGGSPSAPPAVRLALSVEADYEGAEVGHPVTVTAQIRNTSTLWAASVRLKIGGPSIDEFELASATPKPVARGRSGLWETLSYPPLGPGAQQRVVLRVIPRNAGTLHLRVRLVSEDNQFHGMATLPLVVKPASGGQTPEETKEVAL
jgi:hypothetical protein